MLNWSYKGKEIKKLDELSSTSIFGFVYLLTFNDGTQYIGRKEVFKNLKLPALKSGQPRPGSTRIAKNKNGKRVFFDIVQKESNWKTYKSSSKLIGDRTIVSKEILQLASSKRNLTYLETKYLFTYSVLESTNFLNENILGKFYSQI